MATKRRSVREKLPLKYFKESSSEDENDDDKTKAAKQKLKQMMNDDSDIESDFEKELKTDENGSSEENEEDEEDVSDTFEEVPTQKTKSVEKSFCLSESDSSDDDEVVINKKKASANVPNIFLRQESHNPEEEDIEESSQKLLSLAGNLEKMKHVWEERAGNLQPSPKKETKGKGKGKGKEKKPKSIETFETVKKPKREDGAPNEDSITKLLAQGEGVVEDNLVVTSDEEVKEPILPKTGVEITVPLPDHMRKRKKKPFDVQAHLNRLISKGRRELLLLEHKCNIIGLVAHLIHLHQVTSSPNLQCLAMSLVPQSHIFSPDSMTLTRLSHLVSWTRETIPINKHQADLVSIKSIVTRLENALSSLLVMCDMELVLIFVLICRSLGLNTRIVMNFNIPSKSETSKCSGSSKVKVTESKTQSQPSDSEEEPGVQKRKSAKGKTKKRSKSSDSESEVEVKKKVSKSKSKRKDESKSRKRSKSDSESEVETKRKVSKSGSSSGSKSKGSKSSKQRKSSESDSDFESKSKAKTCKAKLSSKLAKAVSARKSKTLAPNASEDTIIKDLKNKADKSKKSSKSQTTTSPSKSEKESRSKRSVLPKKPNEKPKDDPVFVQNYWIEVFMLKEKKWIPVDILTGKVNNPADIESRAAKPVIYVYAVSDKGKIKDVTRRYCSNYLTQTRKLRVEQKFLDETLSRWIDRENSKEDNELTKKSEEAPLPTSVGAFKGHPLYVLQRHLLKFEAIYPADAPSLGFIKGEPVFARECVHTLLGRTAWLKEGKVVRIGEEPYKIVKARPKWDRMSGTKKADEPLELFGPWQTEKYIPPVAVDGKVPRNEYGNVELFKPWMMPGGCVHIPINGMLSVIRKSGIDAAPAMVGWDFSGGGAHPVYDGYVVCQVNIDIKIYFIKFLTLIYRRMQMP